MIPRPVSATLILARPSLDSQGKRYRATGIRKLERVGEQVQYHLLDLLGIADRNACRIDRHKPVCNVFSAFICGSTSTCDVSRIVSSRTGSRDVHGAGVDLRKVQHIVDQDEQKFSAPFYSREIFALGRRSPHTDLHLHELGVSVDGVERSPELMAHHGEELPSSRGWLSPGFSLRLRQFPVRALELLPSVCISKLGAALLECLLRESSISIACWLRISFAPSSSCTTCLSCAACSLQLGGLPHELRVHSRVVDGQRRPPAEVHRELQIPLVVVPPRFGHHDRKRPELRLPRDEGNGDERSESKSPDEGRVSRSRTPASIISSVISRNSTGCPLARTFLRLVGASGSSG